MSTPDIRKTLRRKPEWRVDDFATYMGVRHKTALKRLKRLDAKMGGTLLRASEGANRVYTFYWRAIAKHDPDMLLDDPIDQQKRVDELEDAVDDLKRRERTIINAVGQNARDIVQIRRSGKAA